jgi:hypothetical protein
MNWKIIVGALLIFGAVKEFFSVVGDYNSGKFKSWPLGVETGMVLVIALGIYLIIKGSKERKKIN